MELAQVLMQRMNVPGILNPTLIQQTVNLD